MTNEYYDLAVEEIVAKIKNDKAQRVLIQLPDGLKPEAKTIQEAITKELPKVELCFWGGSAYGACDIPLGVDKLGFDLLLHLGHATWR